MNQNIKERTNQKIDELKVKLLDIINLSESKISQKKRLELDNLYCDIDNQIQSLQLLLQ